MIWLLNGWILKKINKGREPLSLRQYRSSVPTSDMEKSNIYDDYKEKNILRKQLLEEQGYVCCYCMGRISERNSKIEHFKPQSGFREEQINYSNLFVACKGGEGTKIRCCDTQKDNRSLNEINLLTEIESEIKYSKDGEISSKRTTDRQMSSLTREMNDILNLNSPLLVKNRKQTYDNFKNKLKGKWSKSNLRNAIDSYKNKQGDKYAPYSEMMVYLLTKKLNAMN